MKEVVFQKFKEDMEKTIGGLSKSFSRVRTGRASISLLDGIKVDYYDVPTPIAQVANISIPEGRLILIVPWDASIIGAIEKAIQKSDLGLTPSNDGKAVRLSIPQLTEERRKEIAKVVNWALERPAWRLRRAALFLGGRAARRLGHSSPPEPQALAASRFPHCRRGRTRRAARRGDAEAVSPLRGQAAPRTCARSAGLGARILRSDGGHPPRRSLGL